MAYNHESLSCLAFANGFTLWRYQTADHVEEVFNARYFEQAYHQLRVGDFVLLTAKRDGNLISGTMVVAWMDGCPVIRSQDFMEPIMVSAIAKAQKPPRILGSNWTAKDLAEDAVAMWKIMVGCAIGDLMVGLDRDDCLDWAVHGSDKEARIEVVLLRHTGIPDDAIALAAYIREFEHRLRDHPDLALQSDY